MTELETRYYVLKFTYHIVYIKQITEEIKDKGTK